MDAVQTNRYKSIDTIDLRILEFADFLHLTCIEGGMLIAAVCVLPRGVWGGQASLGGAGVARALAFKLSCKESHRNGCHRNG